MHQKSPKIAMRVHFALLFSVVIVTVVASNRAIVAPVNADAWLTECFQSYVDTCCDPPLTTRIKLSNFFLIDKPSGLCQGHLSCAFEKCDSQGIIYVAATVRNFSTVSFDDVNFPNVRAILGEPNLPDEIAYIESVADIVHAIRFAKSVGKKISIKSTGHSYAGSNTKRGSVQLNLRDLKEYTNESVVLCDEDVLSDESGENFYPCKLAVDRNKTALLKVGGGESWSNAYLAVVRQNKSEKGLEIVGGGAGSVGAAGGWLQGGGWSIGVERLYGLGVDQVLQFEMVLADERHVRFGPTEWEPAEGFLYPKTTVVSGKCNKNVSPDESAWVWEECEEPVPPFADLWFAVRGGGGGTYGVVTALKYQLHEKRRMQRVQVSEETGDAITAKLSTLGDPNAVAVTLRFFILFLVDLLFNPSSLGLEMATSNLCGSPSLTFDPVTTLLYCYDDGFEQAKAALARRVDASTDPVVELIADELKNFFEARVISSYPELVLEGSVGPFKPVGRVGDQPLPNFFPDKGIGGWCSAQIPEKWLAQGDRDLVFQLFSSASGEHVTGGNVGIAHDQMTAITKAARETGLSSASLAQLDADFQQRLLSIFLADTVGVGDSFPGITEVNHVCPDSFGPLKSDMMTLCPADFTVEEKEEKCISVQESIWGTETLSRLEDIKSAVDPENLFDCYLCVKPKKPLEESPAPDLSTPEPGPFTIERTSPVQVLR